MSDTPNTTDAPEIGSDDLLTAECDACGESIPGKSNFCPRCGYEQNLVSWDWRECPPWDEINQRLSKGPCQIEDVEMGDDQHYIRITQGS